MEQTFRTSPHCTRANESLLFPGQPCYTIVASQRKQCSCNPNGQLPLQVYSLHLFAS